MLLELYRASCNVPSKPPGVCDAASDSCASFSQLGAVADAALTDAMAMESEPDFVRRTIARFR
jgi:hypothetical protein